MEKEQWHWGCDRVYRLQVWSCSFISRELKSNLSSQLELPLILRQNEYTSFTCHGSGKNSEPWCINKTVIKTKNLSFDFRPITILIFRGLKETVCFLVPWQTLRNFSTWNSLVICLNFACKCSTPIFPKITQSSNGTSTQTHYKAGEGQTFVFTKQREVKFISERLKD